MYLQLLGLMIDLRWIFLGLSFLGALRGFIVIRHQNTSPFTFSSLIFILQIAQLFFLCGLLGIIPIAHLWKSPNFISGIQVPYIVASLSTSLVWIYILGRSGQTQFIVLKLVIQVLVSAFLLLAI